MGAVERSKHRTILRPIVAILGAIALFTYGLITLMSDDPLWFLSRAVIPDPERIVIRVDGVETVLTAPSIEYDLITEASRKALSAFKNWSPGTIGLGEPILAEYQVQGTLLELYFDEPVDFHLPFDDGKPTALLMPLAGRHGGEGYVFRGKHGKWWAGQMTMRDPQPLVDALSNLGYLPR